MLLSTQKTKINNISNGLLQQQYTQQKGIKNELENFENKTGKI